MTEYQHLSPEAVFDEELLEVDRALRAKEHNEKSLYNVAGFRPQQVELSQVRLEVTGELPSDLAGVYLRTGANSQFDEDTVRLHAFNGSGMVHQIEIHGGIATYSNFFVRTPVFEVEKAMGRETYIQYGEIVTGGVLALRKKTLIDQKIAKGLLPLASQLERSTGGTSVRYYNGRLYCLQETGYAFVLTTREVDGRLVIDGSGHLETWEGEWEGPFSAHPRVEPSSGDIYNVSINGDGAIIAGHLSDGQLANQHRVHEQGQAPGEQMAWLHDFFLTENYLIFPDISMRFDVRAAMQEEGSIFQFDRDRPLRWGVLPREFDATTEVTWFETSRAAAVWHVINAWETTGKDGAPQVVLYGPSYPYYPSNVPVHTPDEPRAEIRTWTLDLRAGVVVDERLLLDHGYERPSMNLDYVGRPNRYAYLLDEHGDGYMGVGVLKYDLVEEKEAGYHGYGGMYGGEALFVPRVGGQQEDDGYLVDLLMLEDSAEFVIIDARDMFEVARLRLPQRVPFGVHATWVTEDDLSRVFRSSGLN